VKNADLLLLGITFKENCPDVRNTRVVDIVRELASYEIKLTIYDPWANAEEVIHEYGIDIITDLPEDRMFDAIVLAVAHKDYLNIDWTKKVKSGGIIYDVKGCLDKNMVSARL
jgi:UDP-N-acetyl-D-galactosamine dehydrogenase